MSMEVDLSTPLTQEEYAYLLQRSRQDLINRAHEMHGTSDEDYAEQTYGDGTGPQPYAALQGEARAERIDRLRAELAELEAAAGEEDEEEMDEDEAPAYSDWSVSQLDEELGNRNLPKSGSKSDKVARLEADDAEE